jgi:hypothetical protein
VSIWIPISQERPVTRLDLGDEGELCTRGIEYGPKLGERIG